MTVIWFLALRRMRESVELIEVDAKERAVSLFVVFRVCCDLTFSLH